MMLATMMFVANVCIMADQGVLMMKQHCQHKEYVSTDYIRGTFPII